jgi:dinuclear metal center YbgI/SA1388 family protein
VKIKEIIEKIETFAPLSLAEQWDNTGWQIKLDFDDADKIMLALSPTLDVLQQAKQHGCSLVITHHPLFFSKLKQIIPDVLSNKVTIFAIQNNIQIYSAHTNLDKTQGGINDKLASMLGLLDIEVIDGLVRVGMVDEMSLEEFVLKCKKTLGCNSVKLINPLGLKNVKKVAICSGSGSDFINSVEADIFVTGDVKYHNAIEVLDKAVLDVGHFESERVILASLQEILAPWDTVLADEKNPWELL